MSSAPPPIGTRWRFTSGRTAWRVYELAERVTRDEAMRREQHCFDVNRIVLVEEEGCLPEHCAGVGRSTYVEDRWFDERASHRVKP